MSKSNTCMSENLIFIFCVLDSYILNLILVVEHHIKVITLNKI